MRLRARTRTASMRSPVACSLDVGAGALVDPLHEHHDMASVLSDTG